MPGAEQAGQVGAEASGCTAAIVSQANTAAIPSTLLINISMADSVACVCEPLSFKTALAQSKNINI